MFINRRATQEANMEAFTAGHVSRTHSISLVGAPEQVFPLFEPLKEKCWAPGWEPEMVYPPSGEAVEGAVFTVSADDGHTAIWTIAEYDPSAYRIAYLAITPDSRVARIEVQCCLNTDGTTQAQVTYTFTALSAQGNGFISTQTEESHRHRIESWKTAINHYLRHGEPVQHH
jgi:hypothetical protein